MDEDAADRASQEIKALCRRLDPANGSHKDRIRRLNKFRNFVTGEDEKQPPEFYDDDIPLLMLGSSAPAALLGDDPDYLEGTMYGLIQACGTPSVEHDHMLKRSARHAMSLLKFLVNDYVEASSGDNNNNNNNSKSKKQRPSQITQDDQAPLNLFAQSFCMLPITKYQYLSLDLHLVGDQRGGAKEDACHVMTLLLLHHVMEDGETNSPMSKEDLLASSAAQQAFDVWLTQNCSREVQQVIKKNSKIRQERAVSGGEADHFVPNLPTEDGGGGGPAGATGGAGAGAAGGPIDDDEYEEVEGQDGEDEAGVLAGFRRRKKAAKKEVLEATQAGELEEIRGPALRWEDSQLYREQRARFAAHQRMQEDGEFHDTVRDSQEAAAELAEREEEKTKVLRKDPLGLKGDDFDLRTIENNQVDFLEQALLELQEELRKGEVGGEDSKTLQQKKESLESILDGIVGVAKADGGIGETGRSTLPTEPDFDPLLFLTLVHRKASYEELVGSMDRLSNDTENQVKQLQNMVRENFALFLRCADGIDTFNEKTMTQSGPGLIERLNRLDALAESCAHQAKKSFKPLLDNANEVQKVQSALAVLVRVAPMLQAPYLMRQHVENGRFSQALKAYRRVLDIDEHCNIDLLVQVKSHAAECAREARRELEGRLAQDKISVTTLLDAIRDLGELLELDIPHDPREAEKVAGSRYRAHTIKAIGTCTIGNTSINIRDHPPALACLMLQAAHFSFLVTSTIEEADTKSLRILEGESLSSQLDQESVNGPGGNSIISEEKKEGGSKSSKGSAGSNQWKYDVLEARGLATINSVEVVHTWLPRLIHIAKVAREDEKRRVVRKRMSISHGMDNQLSPFEVVLTNIAPSVTRIVEHATFCGLGSAPRGSGLDVKMTFGKKSPEKLRSLLRSPLPPSQSARVGKELAEMVDVLESSSALISELRPSGDSSSLFQLAPLEECKTIGEQAVMTIEKRRCIYAFDLCARSCSTRASGSGKFDADALLACLKTLSEELTRPDQCASEVEKGCELVVRRCCEGLANYVRDRGDTARLCAVAECADVLLDRIGEVVQEVASLTHNSEAVEEVMMEDIMALEGAMFDQFLESVRGTAAGCCRMRWLDVKTDLTDSSKDVPSVGFPPYLAASLLAIVRCRAQVEQALGDKIRRSEGVTYHHIAMATVSERVVEGMCEQIIQRKMSLKVRQADRLANELQFLMNTLKNYLNSETLATVDTTRRMLCSKAGRGGGIQGDGPDGLAALEDLERLGRVYVLCLGE